MALTRSQVSRRVGRVSNLERNGSPKSMSLCVKSFVVDWMEVGVGGVIVCGFAILAFLARFFGLLRFLMWFHGSQDSGKPGNNLEFEV